MILRTLPGRGRQDWQVRQLEMATKRKFDVFSSAYFAFLIFRTSMVSLLINFVSAFLVVKKKLLLNQYGEIVK